MSFLLEKIKLFIIRQEFLVESEKQMRTEYLIRVAILAKRRYDINIR